MNHLRLLLDVDGVSANFVEAYLSVVNHVLRRNHTAADVTEWEMEKSLGLSAEESRTVSSYIQTRGFASQLQPYPGAVEAIAKLRASHSVYFVTSPYRGPRDKHLSWTADREHWLLDHFGVPHSDVIHTSAKHLVTGDVFVDDNVDNVRRWQTANPSGLALLWYQPYNWEHRGELMVCHSWDHLFTILELLDPDRSEPCRTEPGQ